MEKNIKQRPVQKIEVPVNGSLLRVAIWKHQKADERSNFTVSFSRSYRERDGDKKWASSSFYQRDHLLGLARAMESAHAWIVANQSKEASAK
jgi:hypothetical protein